MKNQLEYVFMMQLFELHFSNAEPYPAAYYSMMHDKNSMTLLYISLLWQ